jgi:hypothetical protein
MENQLIHAIVNAESRVTIEVKTHKLGFMVAVKDIDAGQYFPSMMIVPTLESALKAANKAAGTGKAAA